MATCGNCNAHVTDTYVRVAVPDDERPIEACVFCPDRVRDGGRPRLARSHKGGRASGAAETDAKGRFMATKDGGERSDG